MKLAYTQHQGAQNLKQQDCIWTGEKVIQLADHPITIVDTCEDLLLGLADGVSASPCAELASNFAMTELSPAVQKYGFTNKAIRYIQERLSAKFSRTIYFGTSTTVLALSLHGDQVKIMSVGDCRAYRIDELGHLEQLTKDHSFINQMIDEGNADDQVKYASCYNALTDCLVADPEELDFNIFTETINFDRSDLLFACTDGVHETLGEKLFDLFDANVNIETQAERLREAVLANKPSDNFSFMLLGQ